MRALWTGSLSFGLVNIPVKLYSATQEQGLKFRLLSKKELCPISYARVCRAHDKEIPYDQIVKGFEYEKGEFVVVENSDFERANARKAKTIDVQSFVKLDEVDAKYFEKPYFLEPDKKAEAAYALLREALRTSKMAGVARFVIREREHLGVITVEGDALMLNQIRFAEELRAPDGLAIPKKVEIPDREMKLALLLIEQLTTPFAIDNYHDTYTEELRKVIEAKAHGKRPAKKGKAPTPTAVPDLMDVLRQSLYASSGVSEEKKVRTNTRTKGTHRKPARATAVRRAKT